MSPPVLYYFPPSPSCRAVMLFARAIGLQMEMRSVNVLAGEQFDAEYLKINPQHTIPTLDDNGFILWESAAIMCYLAARYARDDSFYPRDLKRRAIINQLLFFDVGTLNQRFVQYFQPIAYLGEKPDTTKLKQIDEALGFLDKFIEGRPWASGDTCSVADFTLAVSVCNAEAIGVDIHKHPQVSRWYTRVKNEMAGFNEINQVGADMLANILKQKTSAADGEIEGV